MSESSIARVLDILREHGVDDPAILRDLLEAVLVVGQGLDLDEALQRIVEVAVGVVDARYGALGVRGPDGGLSEFVYTGITPAERSAMGSLPVGKGVLGVLINDPHILRIPDLAKHPASVGFPPNHPPMTTFLGAPIIIRGSNFGRIYLTEKRSADEFTPLDEALIAVLAVAAGIAVDNAQLFETSRTRQRWMQVLVRRGSEPLSGIALEDTLSRMCTDVAELVGATDVFIVSAASDVGSASDIGSVSNVGSVGDVGSAGETAGGGDEVVLSGHTGAAFDIDPADFSAPEGSEMSVVPIAEISDSLARRGARWATVQPLQRASGAFGWIVITQPDRPLWKSEEASGLAGVAEVASLAMVYAEQQQVARDLEVLSDRHRIARDLHDHVIQRLFAIGMSIQTMLAAGGGAARVDDTPRAERLEQVMTDLDRTIAQIRTSIFDLQTVPGHHDTATLRRRVLDIVSELSVHAPIAPSVQFDGPVDTVVPDALGPHIDAVLREGLSNALRHAHAEHISVSVSADDVLSVEITDDGVGISTDVTYRGLENLTRRAEECDGTFTVVTNPRVAPGRSSGTTLTWSVPLT